jgi:primary-amine oxidase
MALSTPHPLDPLTALEVSLTSAIIKKSLGNGASGIRFKVIDLAEPSKDLLLDYLYNAAPAPPARKARVYYHAKNTTSLKRAIVNITTQAVERDEELPILQGPVDWTEYAAINDACNAHPEVLAEVAKLKLPKK